MDESVETDEAKVNDHASPIETSTRIPWLAAIALGVTTLIFFGLWTGARNDANRVQDQLDRIEQEEALLPDLEGLARGHLSVSALEDISETSLSLNFRRDTTGLGDLMEEVGFSSGTMARISNTRALDGTLSAQAPHATATWTYHPDDGLSIVIERTG